MPNLPINNIKFITDGGPYLRHNQPCAIWWDEEKAIYDLNRNVFQPSWKAQDEGWVLINVTGWRRFLLRLLIGIPTVNHQTRSTK